MTPPSCFTVLRTATAGDAKSTDGTIWTLVNKRLEFALFNVQCTLYAASEHAISILKKEELYVIDDQTKVPRVPL